MKRKILLALAWGLTALGAVGVLLVGSIGWLVLAAAIVPATFITPAVPR